MLPYGKILRALALAVVPLIAASCGGGQGFKDPGPPVGVTLLPDIVPSPPEHVQMISVAGGGWQIQFSSILVNIGRGDFILRAKRDPSSGRWAVDQIVPYSESGARVVPTPARLVWGGDGHEHWHVARVATNRLYRLGEDGKPITSRSWADSKVGFCYYDFIRHKKNGISEAHYVSRSCGTEGDRYVGMGLSVGWADIYALNLPGQSIDVTDLPDGRYRLEADTDEPGWFRETNVDNNSTWIDIALETRNGVRFTKVVGTGPDPGRRVVRSVHATP